MKYINTGTFDMYFLFGELSACRLKLFLVTQCLYLKGIA